MTQGQKAIVRTIANGQEVCKQFVALNSLAIPGGTLSIEQAETEIQKFYEKGRVKK